MFERKSTTGFNYRLCLNGQFFVEHLILGNSLKNTYSPDANTKLTIFNDHKRKPLFLIVFFLN